MGENYEYTYILYFHIEHIPYNDEIIFLGSGSDLCDLYYWVFTVENIKPENKPILSVWKTLVETELSIDMQYELKQVLKFNFKNIDSYSYSIKHMTIHLEKIQTF